MSVIYEAERLRDQIQNHSHFSKCFFGGERYEFNQHKEKLSKYRTLFDNANKLKNEIIEEYHKRNNKIKEYEREKVTKEKEYENKKEKYKYEEELEKLKFENELEAIINEYNNECLKEKNIIRALEQDIQNLEEEIKLEEEKFNSEIELKKIEALNSIKNKYKIELIKYQHSKDLEKKEKEVEMEVKKKEFESKKEIEINDLKNKAMLSQKIIFMFNNLMMMNMNQKV